MTSINSNEKSSSTSQLIPAPQRPAAITHPTRSIFLAGSTSSTLPGPSSDWRGRLASRLSGQPVTIYDPARSDWDDTWRESEECELWREQVAWELDMQEAAAVVVVWFAKDTKAPVSLLELGMVAKEEFTGGGGNGDGERKRRRRSKAVVVCEEGFWKEGNVRMVCNKYGVEIVDGFEALVGCLTARFGLA